LLGKITPELQLVYTGNSASFTCSSESEPIWVRQRTPHGIKNYVVVVGEEDNPLEHTIVLINLSEKDTGEYYCLGKKDGKEFRASATLYVGG